MYNRSLYFIYPLFSRLLLLLCSWIKLAHQWRNLIHSLGSLLHWEHRGHYLLTLPSFQRLTCDLHDRSNCCHQSQHHLLLSNNRLVRKLYGLVIGRKCNLGKQSWSRGRTNVHGSQGPSSRRTRLRGRNTATTQSEYWKLIIIKDLSGELIHLWIWVLLCLLRNTSPDTIMPLV